MMKDTEGWGKVAFFLSQGMWRIVRLILLSALPHFFCKLALYVIVGVW